VAKPDDDHYARVVKYLIEGTVVPLLGAGVNMCGRPESATWSRDAKYLPDGRDLARYLAEYFNYPYGETKELDLARVSQYGAVMDGSGPLYKALQNLFTGQYEPTAVHRFLAALPGALEERGHPRACQLIITTNYDDALESAFRNADPPREFDLVTYMADGPHRGKFVHVPAGAEPIVISMPNQYVDLPIDEAGDLARTVILKIHGAVDRKPPGTWKSYVITEDHYIDYLSRSDLSNLVPAALVSKMLESHFLFLGYSMRDWNLRAILHRIWGEQPLSYKSWSVQLNPERLDEEFWEKRGVDILDAPIDEYVAGLDTSLGVGQPAPAGS
jgi:hypothetical protein